MGSILGESQTLCFCSEPPRHSLLDAQFILEWLSLIYPLEGLQLAPAGEVWGSVLGGMGPQDWLLLYR